MRAASFFAFLSLSCAVAACGESEGANNQTAANATMQGNTTQTGSSSSMRSTLATGSTALSSTTALLSTGNSSSSLTSTSTDFTAGTVSCLTPPTVYKDADEDGQGDTQMSMVADSCDLPQGYALGDGDCKDMDPIAYTGAEGVCGDFVDDDCDDVDEKCPESLPAKQLMIPSWDCASKTLPPENVYGYANIETPGDRLKPGACFVFFEGAKDRFYVKAFGIEAAMDCEKPQFGCICPSTQGKPSYDRRLYAFSLRAGVTTKACAEVALIDNGKEEQPVSNQCRKYLYQLHARAVTKPIEFSHVASSLEALEHRLKFFPTVEIACAADKPRDFLPFASLASAPVTKNTGFVKMK